MVNEPSKEIPMTAPFSRPSRNSDLVDGPSRPARRFGFRALTAAALAAVLLGLGVLTTPSRSAKAGDDGKTTATPAQASPQAFLREIQRTVKGYDDRLVSLAKQVLQEDPDSPQSIRNQLVNMRIAVKNAEADYTNARLTHEVAEIALKEYTEGVYVQDLATAEQDIARAKRDLERAKDMIELVKARQASIKEVADENEPYGRHMNFVYDDLVRTAELGLQPPKFAIEVAEMKKKTLVEVTKLKATKELESDIKKAHSDELAKQATWELEKAKLNKMQNLLKSPWPASSIGKRLFALLDRALPIEEQIHAKLDQLAKDGKSDEPLQKEIVD
jgi:hypothetical protein